MEVLDATPMPLTFSRLESTSQHQAAASLIHKKLNNRAKTGIYPNILRANREI
jgi:hypothetical protein